MTRPPPRPPLFPSTPLFRSAVDIMHLLEERGADVCYHDPYVPEVRHDGTVLKSVPLTAEELQSADCVVIATDHSALDYELINSASRRVVDTRNALRKVRKT